MRTELCAISPAIHLLGNRSSLSGLAKFFTENKVRILRIIISLRAEDVAEISPKKSTEDVLIFWFADAGCGIFFRVQREDTISWLLVSSIRACGRTRFSVHQSVRFSG